VCFQSVFGTILDQVWQARKRRLKTVPPKTWIDHVYYWFGRLIVLTSAVQMCLGNFELRLPHYILAIYLVYFLLWISFVVYWKCCRKREGEKNASYTLIEPSTTAQ
jgi:hypothetical protein